MTTHRQPRQAETRCAQCGTAAPLQPSEHGDLCQICAFRQSEHDNARDRFDHLATSTFGFRSDDE